MEQNSGDFNFSGFVMFTVYRCAHVCLPHHHHTELDKTDLISIETVSQLL
jgi:hypothetical protein